MGFPALLRGSGSHSGVIAISTILSSLNSTVAASVSCGSSTGYAEFTMSPGTVICAVSVQPSGWTGTLSISGTGVYPNSFSLSSPTLPSNVVTNTTVSTTNQSGDLTHLTISASP